MIRGVRATVTVEDVLEMRRLKENGWTYAKIGRKFGVHVSTAERWVKRGPEGLEMPVEPPLEDCEYRDILASHGVDPAHISPYHQLLSKETLERHLTRFQPADGARSASK